MVRSRFLKLALLILLGVAVFFGAQPGGPTPAFAINCPASYGTCCRVSIVCDGSGYCCCYYVSPDGFCPDYCSG